MIRLKVTQNFNSPVVRPMQHLIILLIKINACWFIFLILSISGFPLPTIKSYYIALSIRFKGPQPSDIFSLSKYFWVVIKLPLNILSNNLNGVPLISQHNVSQNTNHFCAPMGTAILVCSIQRFKKRSF